MLVFKQPWPSIARTVWRDHDRYMNTYFKVYNGHFVSKGKEIFSSRTENLQRRQMTGDSAYRDQDGYYQIMGRVDDVVNISGHRLSTAEIESALLDHGNESQVLPLKYQHPLTLTRCFCRSCSCWRSGRNDRSGLGCVCMSQERPPHRQRGSQVIRSRARFKFYRPLCSSKAGTSRGRSPKDKVGKDHETYPEENIGGRDKRLGRYLDCESSQTTEDRLILTE